MKTLVITSINKVRTIASDRFINGFGWMAGADFAARVTRILTTIILARYLTPLDFGMAAVAITTFEIVRLFIQNGLSAALIKAGEKDLSGLSLTVHRLAWCVCIALFLIQTGIGVILAHITGQASTGWMITALAGVYLHMPFGVLHAWTLQRQERLKRIAGVASVQMISDNALTAVLAIAGLGPWAIVLPKLITAPIWLVGIMWARPWRPDRSAKAAPAWPIVKFATPVLMAELTAGLRQHLDKLIVGALFGLEGLGIYFFAFNAGVGLSASLSSAFNAALMPRLCQVARDGQALLGTFTRLMKTSGLVISAILLIQAAATFIYVPILFGNQWAVHVPVVAILCLSGPGRFWADASNIALRASGRSGLEFMGSSLVAIAVTLGLIAGSSFGLTGAATGVAIAATIAGASLIVFIHQTLDGSSPSTVSLAGGLS